MDLVMQAIGFGASAWLLWRLASWLGGKTEGVDKTPWDHAKTALGALAWMALLFVVVVWLEESCGISLRGARRWVEPD